jgi:16S rRNA pseudouridine516 synthase
MHIADMLFTQGFGTRRVCAGLLEQGLVHLGEGLGDALGDKNKQFSDVNIEELAINNIADGFPFTVQGVGWEYHDKAYIMLHKPAGFECSHKPSAWPSVYTLLPSPLRLRPNKNAIQGVQAVGRLDQDTTGMLLMSDDGQFIHRMSSPKHHVPKLYQVTCKHAVDDAQIAQLLAGVVLDDSPKPVRAAQCAATGELTLDLTLTEGKYHQVKRMIAAVGNRVEALHRASMGHVSAAAGDGRSGGLSLGDLPSGQWRWLTGAELAVLQGK